MVRVVDATRHSAGALRRWVRLYLHGFTTHDNLPARGCRDADATVTPHLPGSPIRCSPLYCF
jgi:hypothetical protein